jgi:hypothetical protein
MNPTKPPTRVALLLAALLMASLPVFAQQTFNTTIYLDWTQFMSKDGFRTADQKNSFFAFRRAYFTYENKINDNLKFRFRFDADNTANLTSISVNFPSQSVSTKKDDKLRPFIKHLYLEYSNLLPNSSIKIGMTETLTFKPAEDRWGYRSVAKTLVDGYKDITGVEIDATSADIGASLTGSLTKYFRYGFMVSNGAHYSHAENDKYKKLMFQGQIVPLPGLSLIGYMDYEKQDASNSAVTYKVDAFIEMIANLTVGGEWFSYRNDKNLVGEERFDSSGFSVFGRYTIDPDKLALFARFDRYEPNNLVADNEINLAIVGVDWAPFHKSWKLQPNVWYYDYADPTKKRDLIFNLTFFLSF